MLTVTASVFQLLGWSLGGPCRLEGTEGWLTHNLVTLVASQATESQTFPLLSLVSQGRARVGILVPNSQLVSSPRCPPPSGFQPVASTPFVPSTRHGALLIRTHFMSVN